MYECMCVCMCPRMWIFMGDCFLWSRCFHAVTVSCSRRRCDNSGAASKGKKAGGSSKAAPLKPSELDAMIAEASVLTAADDEPLSVLVDYSEVLPKEVESSPGAQALLAWLGENTTRAAFSKDWKSR